MSRLHGKDVSWRYDRTAILDAVDLAAEPGQIHVVLGPNGAGKTTFLRILSRLLRPPSGRVEVGESEIWGIPHRLLSQQLALAAQIEPNYAALTVEQTVALGRAPHRGWLLPLRETDHAVVEKVLAQTGLQDLRKRLLQQLSGGEQRRVLIARSLAQEPAILLLDEPTAYLDLRYQVEILTLLRQLAVQRQMTIVLTMHDLNQAAAFGDRFTLLAGAKVLATGDAATVLTARNIETAYQVPVTVSVHPVHGTPLITPTGEGVHDD